MVDTTPPEVAAAEVARLDAERQAAVRMADLMEARRLRDLINENDHLAQALQKERRRRLRRLSPWRVMRLALQRRGGDWMKTT